MLAFFACFQLVWQASPKLLLVNGPGTCVPVVIATRLLAPRTKIIYIESICRVKTLSLSAKILWYFLDVIIVQWPELSFQYQGTKYIGKFL